MAMRVHAAVHIMRPLIIYSKYVHKYGAMVHKYGAMVHKYGAMLQSDSYVTDHVTLQCVTLVKSLLTF